VATRRCSTPANKHSPLIAVLCDGAGSASMGGEGASLVARIVASRARTRCRAGLVTLPDDVVWSWVSEARDHVARAAAKRDLTTRDFAATLICAISDGSETVVAHVGDGSVVIQDAGDKAWHVPSWPSHGEYASTTFFVTDEPQPKLVLHRRSGSISALVAFTDGLERLALDFGSTQAHAPFFQGILGPVATSSTAGRDDRLCAALARYLESDAVNARTDDDKTLLVAAYR
jgi:protein phosphatase 2C-like protein